MKVINHQSNELFCAGKIELKNLSFLARTNSYVKEFDSLLASTEFCILYAQNKSCLTKLYAFELV